MFGLHKMLHMDVATLMGCECKKEIVLNHRTGDYG